MLGSVLLLLVGCTNTLQQQDTTTHPPPPKPFKFAYAAARLPGAQPDRYVESEGDEAGVIRGSYAYLDPNYEWRQVQYVADKDGFHVDPSVLPVASPLNLPHDTVAVANAKLQHQQLFEAIALRNSQLPVAPEPASPLETKAVANNRAQFQSDFERIAAEHARIAAEHQKLAEIEERERLLAEASY